MEVCIAVTARVAVNFNTCLSGYNGVHVRMYLWVCASVIPCGSAFVLMCAKARLPAFAREPTDAN
jgi:hypothetical protein